MTYNVQPLRTAVEIQQFIHAVSVGRFSKRNRFLVLLGMNTGLRMSDIVRLRVADVKRIHNCTITEQKTGKKRLLYLASIREEVMTYIDGLPDSDYLFVSSYGQPLRVNSVYKIFQKAALQLNRHDIGTHTLRKTFGYHYYQQTHDIATLMILLNHSSESVTKRYLGIEELDIQNALRGFRLGK
ncbi:tyrosine-type recombinase/integrase [Furfurilactobacillus rossiae]|uniref:tyrosine-type recombinase/integrase n=1 Tax=Furfurilactobacillus rossiae TaxID=231049 RepID=UPI000315D5C2|nr:tyrosine-type recombinase/integrase [Furfurilactobacillus rossiae]QFR67576.1 tyrosine-type recombinase/integrase [Furfurilactobacillus rossiae]QLE60531.1 integrase-recombinase [Furfurilactobacillus rossiae]